MAEEALKKLNEQLNCSVCLDVFTDPKQLQCHHVYCRQCLVPLVVRDQQGKLGLTCPKCRQITSIGERGVTGLQSAFQINNLLEIQESFKYLENPTANLADGAVGGTTSGESTRDELRYCSEHTEEELRLYCETCGELVCLQCIIKGGKHHNHECLLLKAAFEKHKKEIASSLKPIENQVVTIREALAQLHTCHGEVTKHKNVIEDKIHSTFGHLRVVLNNREAELVNQLSELTDAKLKALATQVDQLETTLAKLNSCLLFMSESLATGKEKYLLRMKTNTVERMKEAVTPFQPDILKPNARADLVFSTSRLAGLNSSFNDYGEIMRSDFADPSNCYAIVERTALVGEKSVAVLRAINFNGKPCEEPIRSLKCEVISFLTGVRTKCRMDKRGENQYELSYLPAIKGSYRLSIKAEGQHVKGSPFSVAVTSSIMNVGTPILSIDRVEGPQGVAVNRKGEMLVTVEGTQCVTTFGPNGSILRSFGRCGSRSAQFLNPWGIAMDTGGNVLIADTENHRVQKFSPDDQFLAEVGTKGDECLQFSYPTDIAFNVTNDRVYVLDMGNYRVQVLNSDLTFAGILFGKAGSGNGEFSGSARGIACNSTTGKVYVADSGNHRIQVFSADGEFLSTFGRYGTLEGELNWPNSVAIDSRGRVYVSERDNHRVSVFTWGSQFMKSFGSKGKSAEELDKPRGLAVDKCGVIYVCDYGNNRVQVF